MSSIVVPLEQTVVGFYFTGTGPGDETLSAGAVHLTPALWLVLPQHISVGSLVNVAKPRLQ